MFIATVGLFLFIHTHSLAVIDIAFTVKNLSTNDRLQQNFLTMITSLFEHTSPDGLHLHIIGDSDSHRFVEQTFHQLHLQPSVSISSLTALAIHRHPFRSPN